MIQIQSFIFNGFQENTYLLFDETKECIIIDPGCYDEQEQKSLEKFMTICMIVYNQKLYHMLF